MTLIYFAVHSDFTRSTWKQRHGRGPLGRWWLFHKELLSPLSTVRWSIISHCGLEESGELNASFFFKTVTKQWISFYKWLVFYHRQYQIKVFFLAWQTDFWNCIHPGSHSYCNRVHVKFPHKHSQRENHKKHIEIWQALVTGAIWKNPETVCTCVCVCLNDSCTGNVVQLPSDVSCWGRWEELTHRIKNISQ